MKATINIKIDFGRIYAIILSVINVRTWEDFKKTAKKKNDLTKQDIEEMEELASIISFIIERRNELGYSQRELADICGLPHSSVARIEACTVKPNVETLIRIMRPLGLTLSVSER